MEILFNYIFAVMQPFSKDGWQILSLIMAVILLYKNWRIWKKDTIIISVFLFLLYVSISTLFSPDKIYSFNFLSRYFVGFGFSFIIGYSLNSTKHKEKLISTYIWVFTCLVLFGFMAYVGIIPHKISFYTLVNEGRLCVSDWATVFAGRCEFIIMIFAALILFEEKKEKIYKYSFILLVFITALILSGARQSYIATFCSCLLLFSAYFYIKKSVKKQVVFIIIMIAVFSIAYFFNSNINSRINNVSLTNDSSIASRITMYKMSMELIKEKPLLGHTTATAGKQLMVIFNKHIKHFHNIYLNTLVDFGIVGFILFIFIFYTLFGRLIRKYKETKSPYMLMLFFAWIAVLISDCFDALLLDPACSGLFFWVTGLILSEQKSTNKV